MRIRALAAIKRNRRIIFGAGRRPVIVSRRSESVIICREAHNESAKPGDVSVGVWRSGGTAEAIIPSRKKEASDMPPCAWRNDIELRGERVGGRSMLAGAAPVELLTFEEGGDW